MPLLVVKYDPRNPGVYQRLLEMADDHNKDTGLFRGVALAMSVAGRTPHPEHVEFDPSPYDREARHIPALKVTLHTSHEPVDLSGETPRTPWSERRYLLRILAVRISLGIRRVPQETRARGNVMIELETGGNNASLVFDAGSGVVLSVWNLPPDLDNILLGSV